MNIINFLQSHMLQCPSMALLHIECPGCGMQRSLICLLKGEWANSLRFHPATVPMLTLIGFAGLHLLFRFDKGARVIVILQLLVAIITVTFYIYKITQYKIFT